LKKIKKDKENLKFSKKLLTNIIIASIISINLILLIKGVDEDGTYNEFMREPGMVRSR